MWMSEWCSWYGVDRNDFLFLSGGIWFVRAHTMPLWVEIFVRSQSSVSDVGWRWQVYGWVGSRGSRVILWGLGARRLDDHVVSGVNEPGPDLWGSTTLHASLLYFPDHCGYKVQLRLSRYTYAAETINQKSNQKHGTSQARCLLCQISGTPWAGCCVLLFFCRFCRMLLGVGEVFHLLSVIIRKNKNNTLWF